MSYRYNRRKKNKRKAKGDSWRKERNRRRNNRVIYNKSCFYAMTPECEGKHEDL